MRISRQFAPMSLEIETEDDFKTLLMILSCAEVSVAGKPWATKADKEFLEDIRYLRNKLKGN